MQDDIRLMGAEPQSTLTVDISPVDAAAMERIIAAVECVVALPGYQQAALAYADPISYHRPGPLGGLLGYDFHLGAQGPSLIEINTNAGGIMLCGGQQPRLAKALLELFLSEWQLAGHNKPLSCVAIVDEDPEGQFLFPEFVAFQQLLQRSGISTEIAAPQQLRYVDGRLLLNGVVVDLVYNRLTDFLLEQVEHSSLRQAYLAGDVVLTPHPLAHALYADKRNMILLGDQGLLARLEVPLEWRETLRQAIPTTQRLSAESAEALWRQRRQLFFKPSHGYGSKGVYQGEKLTRRVWEMIVQQGNYVAQQWVPPSRWVTPSGEFKVDLRHYVYRGSSLLLAARLYRGQTTNLRTQGGGFASVRVIDAASG